LKKLRLLTLTVLAVVAVAVAYVGRGFYRGAMTIHDLLGENQQLKEAITNLTSEDQIGYAKVISQRTDENGRLWTTLRFVETSREDKTKKILQKEYTIEGDVIHFDALIVKFTDQMVMDGKARALYLWRRVYGEKTPPQEGFPIEEPDTEPKRYADLLKFLPAGQQELFWSSIWDLANNPEALAQYGIKAIYGNVIYSQLREGLIYVFKIGPTGHLYVEDVLDM
jgi:ABC-type glycerol-3-phosphate transport system substrate-binding protein